MIPQQEQMMLKQWEKNVTFKAYVGQQEFIFQMDRNSVKFGNSQIKVADLIGIIPALAAEDSFKRYDLFSYPRRKKFMKSIQRYVERLKFQIRDENGWQSKLRKIKSIIYNRPPDKHLKLLIYYNPVSGANSQKHLTNILNFIKCTNLEPEVFTTNHRNHCIEHLKTLDVDDYCGVAIVSGDGLMHQYVNSFCRIPVTHVPAGSGNAFAKTQMTYAGQLCKDEESIFLVIKNRPKQFNLVKYELEKTPEPIYSFLSLQWAMIADLDINSQFLRCLGALRFQIYAAWLILKHKRYRARLTYSTIQRQMPSFNANLQNNANYHTLEQQFSHTIFCTIPFISEKHKMAPLLKQDEHYIDMQVLTHQTGRYQLLKYLISSDSGSQFDLQQGQPATGYQFMYRKITSFRLEPLDPNQPGVFCIDGESYESQRLQAGLSDRTFLAFL